MRLAPEQLPEYVDLLLPEASLERRRKAVEVWRRRIEIDPGLLANLRVLAGPAGMLLAAVQLSPLRGEEWCMSEVALHPERRPPPGALELLMAEAVQRARVLGVARLSTRIERDSLGAAYEAALLAAGFRWVDERIEFLTPLEELPEEEESPFVWRDLSEIGLTAAGNALLRASLGDPTADDEQEDPQGAIRAFLAEPDLLGGPECVQVGYREGEPGAFVLAQASPDGRFGRITYLGLVPELRGRGLGRRVQLHGLAMLRRQGARKYVGGTSNRNAPMLACFRALGCREYLRLVEYRWENPDRGSASQE